MPGLAALVVPLLMAACAAPQPGPSARPTAHPPAATASAAGAPARYAFTARPGELLDLALGRPLRDEELGKRLGGARLVFLGEQHDEPDSHRFQERAIRALIGEGKDVYVALEMLPPDANEALADWSRGKIDEREFLIRTNWYEHWGFAWSHYRGLFMLFRDQRLPVRGVNITREQRRMASEGKIAPELIEEVGELDLTVEPHQAYLADTLNEVGHGNGALSPGSPQFDRFLRVQVLWDHAMGTRAAQLTRAGTAQQVVVVLIGSGHLQHKLGANLRAARARPDIPQLTVVESLVPEDKTHATAKVSVPLGLADLVRVGYIGKDSAKPASLAGLKLSAVDGGVRLDGVHASPDSPLRALKEGDLVESLNGKAFRHPVDLRLAYETFPPGSTAHWGVRRDGKPLKLDVRVE